jgi:hypothetical protein
MDQMRRAVFVWNCLEKRAEKALSQHFVWEEFNDTRMVSYRSSPESDSFHDRRVASEESPGQLWEELKGRDVFKAAWFYLMQLINERLDVDAKSVLAWVKATKRVNRVFAPKNLLGALWLQFEQAITGKADYRECEVCGELFDVSGFGRRSDKRYCTDACRAKASREWRKQALEMWAGGKGKSVKEIAEQLGVEEGKVRTCVSGQSKRKEK